MLFCEKTLSVFIFACMYLRVSVVECCKCSNSGRRLNEIQEVDPIKIFREFPGWQIYYFEER